MADSLAAVSGLASGLDWRNIIDQIIQIERRSIDVYQNQRDKYDSQLSEWKNIQAKLKSLQEIVQDLKKEKAYKLFSASLSSSSSKNAEDILSVSTTNAAAKGTYNIRILQKAQSLKVGSASFSSRNSALGLSGEFLINGKAVKIDSTDTLEDIRDKINNLNSGTDATNVTATILEKNSSSFQLILTSDNTGKDGFSLLDASATDILQSLGFVSSSVTIKNRTSDGAKSDAFTSSATAVASLRGLNSPPSATTVTIAGQSVTIDLSSESLTDIAANINALTGVSAQVVTETDNDGNTLYRIDISGTTSFSDSNNVLQILGILEGTRTSINEIHVGSVANQAIGGGAITNATQWSQIDTGGGSNNIALNDTITITGIDHNGNSVSTTFTITDLNQALNATGGFLETIENAFGGSSVVDAYISDGTDGFTAGQLVIKDLQAGESQLSVTITTNNEGGGTLDFGTISETVTGRDMELVSGQNAMVEVDGVLYERSSNSIGDLISGVTLNLISADSSTTVTLAIARDVEAIKEDIQSFVDSYNEVMSAISEQLNYDTEKQEPGGVLFGDGTLRSVKTDLMNQVIQTISGLSSSYTSLALIGIKLDNAGQLSIKDSTLTNLLNNNYSDVVSLLAARGTGSISTIQYISHSRNTVAGTYTVNITQVAEKASVTGTVDLSGGISGAETVTITDSLTGRIATINLNTGDTIDEIVSKFNTEFSTEYAQTITGSQNNTKISSAGGGAITAQTVWGDINTGGDSNNIVNGDTISFSGTRRDGVSVSGTYTISDKGTDTVQGLLSAIESAFNNEVYATIDSSGAIVVTDRQTGTSQLSFSITANNEGGGSLTFGTTSVTTTGRYAIEMTASKNTSNQLVLTHKAYGSSYGFQISQTVNNLGITDGTYSGKDVAGTINGEAATGNGQVLTGNSGEANVDGLVIKYTGTSTGNVGTITLTLGVMEQFDRKLFDILDDFEGYVKYKMDSLSDNIDRIDDKIDQLERNLELKRERLISKFLVMEELIAKLNAQSAWLGAQLGGLTA
ncbi:MAG: flagellar filament capping protein FliD [candidate division KSB1 bacterium]|nr:flagellar filament capping protein FliD [candidate division KSB1 bacterium]